MRPFTVPFAVLALCTTGGCAPNGAENAPAPGATSQVSPVTPGAGQGEGQSVLLVRVGADALADSLPAVLRGRRVGLITNHTGRDTERRSTADVLHAHPGLELVALYGPEHGIRGTAAPGERVDSARDERTGLPVHSLYGATQKPTPEMLRDVEALVFDIQDVGARPYTYIYTMALAMQAAREQNIPFVVLDRPNPINGLMVEGNMLDTAFASFVGMYPIPIRHGMTVGELAQLFNRRFGIGVQLTVVRMAGWRRDLWWNETGQTFIPPSPNIPRLESAIHYPGTVFFEGTNLSEGRGTSHPFEQTGAPWLRAREVADAMNAMRLPGVAFEAVTFTPVPTAAKFGGRELQGVRLVLTDRDVYQPVSSALLLIDMIRRMHPNEFQFTGATQANPDRFWLDRLAGTDRLRRAMIAGTLRDLLAEWDREAEAFRQNRQEFLLY